LDIACGDGVGLKVFKEMVFKNVIGVELSNEKIEKAMKIGYKIFKADMHNLDIFNNDYFDIIYSFISYFGTRL
jgi:ubiquinone/menaquinone biosynthesis C-methylase UbiE